ncbi:MAG: glycosyltransferase family 2 protein [Candidatus Marinimicrobia bacterium]|jgi:hypothetical protein|nr:glycosyltransferase family 2 protein [Candidatus Neomarinimicrobiota bacterium]MBT3633285.1 glycosyltransferase family 2 protein [Candidatus Neomarinimicrobiota bacterium]MBT3681428.1 glycosyltransferase family 2 protein [Candidatus Neomarinimicrobiota bacterium]MBT3758605.1 glycosyltransferase family 2 protein [Candidatus Neomarinimicrobiota bacterium]MBT3894741.1 glycosyltransferase family 2 protein [Candidatus Neomarinimicrobiota bacterium]
MKPIIISPAFNTHECLPELLKQISIVCDFPILIIDDGSNPPINNIFGDHVTILQNRENKGKGYSLLKGFKYAINHGYSHAITIDSDLQHPPKYISDFINNDEDIDLIIGSRSFVKSMPMHRKFSNTITSGILSWLCKIKIPDSQSGYRRYKLEPVLNHPYNENGFMFESEVLITFFRKQKLKFNYIFIDTVYNHGQSNIRNISDTMKFIKLIIRTIIT